MTRNNTKKCIVYLRSNKDSHYSVCPSEFTISNEDDDLLAYTFLIDISKTNVIKFIISRLNNHAHLKIEKILVNGVEIVHLNSISYLQTKSGNIRKTFGYIDEIGEYVIKIHTNPVSQNYLTYLLSLTK